METSGLSLKDLFFSVRLSLLCVLIIIKVRDFGNSQGLYNKAQSQYVVHRLLISLTAGHISCRSLSFYTKGTIIYLKKSRGVISV